MRPSRFAGFLAVSVVPAALAGAGCDWRDFDTIQAHTPVLAMGAPSQFPVSSDFGRYVLPLAAPPSDSTGGSFVVSAASDPGLALINVDAKGQPHGQTVSAPLLDTASGGTGLPVTAMAEVPGANQVLLGVPSPAPGMGGVFLMALGPTPAVTSFAAPTTEADFGLGVAAGKLAGADAPELVVASATDITVYLDGNANMPVSVPSSTGCPLEVTGNALGQAPFIRPVLVAQLSGASGPQIVVGTPATAGGSVSVFTVDATSGAATCALSYSSPPDAGFGTALATGDFDGDGTLDLLIGSPPEHAFWIRGPLTSTSQVLPVTLSGSGGGALGATVAAVNVDGVPGDEAIIGDPQATVGGNTLAGEVHIVGGAMLDTEQAILQRHAPATNDAFGVEVHALPFCTSACGTSSAVSQNLVLVGSDTHAYVFFQPIVGAVDPRTK